ncbi:cation-translocating P-type ATPase [uncultured Piscinibacter sp.]|uniref:cation-translocating P-type ATPase n=1 Tax=uncultured Piscinibacter sp. TaxID=1131835 RepID=UPI00261A1926|nr:cation-translocating P-type ATPase [uncultured Piscinibacter sp.]
MVDAPPPPPTGLTQAEADRRLREDGANELSPPRRRTPLRIALEVAREPMFQLLAAACLLYLLIGDLGEASMLSAFVVMIAAISIAQEHRTERALEALRDLSSPRALVLRDGVPQRIAGREVVRGDLLMLAEGDRVPADAQLLSAHDLQADESLLSGESMPVAKAVAEDATGCVYAGTLLVSGQGLACATATGAASEIGRIGKALVALEPAPTPLQRQTRALVRLFSALGLAVSAAAVLLYGLLRGDWLAGLLAGITLAMSMLPQEFLLILTVFMATGAWRLARQRVLTRRAATIEALGAATVLCTDKTGTLTENRMAVAALVAADAQGLRRWQADEAALPEAFHCLAEYGLLASERKPFDPMDRAFETLAREKLPAPRRHADWALVREYGLAPDCMAMTHAWRAPGAIESVVAVKGAPEAVAVLCRLAPQELAAWQEEAQRMAARGLRVLAVAGGTAGGDAWPATPSGFELHWLGLVALADPLRQGVPAAVQECREAGIRVLMITGDHPATAHAIAAQAGIAADAVHARVRPEEKLQLVEALKACGEVVAMTGDGVNDAPSLKAAHIGVAMGSRGTDVAREAASLVLLDDDFGSIVRAVRLGRRIHDNLRKAMRFVFAVHVPIAGLALLPLLFGTPLLFTPLHIAFLELVIDPVCSIVFEAEPEEADVMRRPPRDPGAPLFSPAMIAAALAQGALVLATVAGFHAALLQMQLGEAASRAAAFVALVACNGALILSNRAFDGALLASLRRPNPMLWRMLAATAAMLALVLAVPPLRTQFAFALPPAWSFGAAALLALAVLAVLETAKRLRLRG